ncbi:MAG: hypothetical protein KC656_07430 [Myxococcales bacterium]|nr:hypothetical protein [Myxococcales bacterium]
MTHPALCPACQSPDIMLFRQPSSKFSSGGAVPGVRCRTCGHRAVGSRFPEHLLPFLMSPPPRPPASERPKATWPPRPPVIEPPRPKVRAVAKAPRVEPAPAPAPVTPEEPVEACAWDGCSKAARPGSKYCSRACSNRNARARYKKRHADDELSAA